MCVLMCAYVFVLMCVAMDIEVLGCVVLRPGIAGSMVRPSPSSAQSQCAVRGASGGETENRRTANKSGQEASSAASMAHVDRLSDVSAFGFLF